MYHTYILQSEKDTSYYIGSTNSIEKRLLRHNNGGSRFTRSKVPLKLVYKEEYDSRAGAMKREKYLKSLKKRSAIEKIINRAPFV